MKKYRREDIGKEQIEAAYEQLNAVCRMLMRLDTRLAKRNPGTPVLAGRSAIAVAVTNINFGIFAIEIATGVKDPSLNDDLRRTFDNDIISQFIFRANVE